MRGANLLGPVLPPFNEDVRFVGAMMGRLMSLWVKGASQHWVRISVWGVVGGRGLIADEVKVCGR